MKALFRVSTLPHLTLYTLLEASLIGQKYRLLSGTSQSTLVGISSLNLNFYSF